MHEAHEQSLWSPGLVFLPGLAYEFFVRVRNVSYDSKLLTQRCLPHPVISIGNVTMGGSGKTPLVIYMAQLISRLGRTPVMLSRGYGRAGKNPLIVPPQEHAAIPPHISGDEPALIRRHAPEIWLGIHPDRYAVGLQIGRQASNPVFILDDGFQHRRLRRDIDIVVIDRIQPLKQNRVLPRGTLREPLTGLRRAGILVINGAPSATQEDPVEDLIRNLNPEAVVFHCIQKIDRLIEFSRWRTDGAPSVPCGSRPKAFLAAAIGNPARFRKDAREFGIEIQGERFFRDHYRLNPYDWRTCTEAARSCGAETLLTTEKDAIKITGEVDFPLLVAVQSMDLIEQTEMERRLQSMIEDEN